MKIVSFPTGVRYFTESVSKIARSSRRELHLQCLLLQATTVNFANVNLSENCDWMCLDMYEYIMLWLACGPSMLETIVHVAM